MVSYCSETLSNYVCKCPTYEKYMYSIVQVLQPKSTLLHTTSVYDDNFMTTFEMSTITHTKGHYGWKSVDLVYDSMALVIYLFPRTYHSL